MIDAARTPFTAALDAHIRAIQTRDLVAFAETITRDDAIRLIGPGGTMLVGREAVLSAHRDWFASGDWSFQPRVVWRREASDMALALLDVDYTERKESERKSRFLLSVVFAREGDGCFRLVYDQNTPIA